MPGWRERLAWAATFPLQAKPVTLKIAPTLAERRKRRLAHVEQLLKGWKSRAKRAATAIAKYQRQARQLERLLAVPEVTVLAAAAKPVPVDSAP